MYISRSPISQNISGLLSSYHRMLSYWRSRSNPTVILRTQISCRHCYATLEYIVYWIGLLKRFSFPLIVLNVDPLGEVTCSRTYSWYNKCISNECYYFKLETGTDRLQNISARKGKKNPICEATYPSYLLILTSNKLSLAWLACSVTMKK